MKKIIVTGAKGKMGQALLRCAAGIPELTVAAALEKGDSIDKAISGADVLVEFSAPGATLGFIQACAAHGKAAVIGTTGHSAGLRREIEEFATRIPIVWASNFSTGVNALFWLTKKAVEILGPAYDLEIVEMHHRLKKDAPSGTAETLAHILAKARGLALPDAARHGREGITGARTSAEIGIHSIRGGDVVGDHTVIFSTQGERVELTHKASSRDTFAMGALRAAQWVCGKPPGLYSMQDVLGLK